jgi:SHS2 domain-containing protein
VLKHQGKRFRIIEHEADIGLEVYGKEQAGLFRNAAYALFSLITDPDPIEAGFTRHITITTTDGGELLVVFLNELLYLWATENFIPRNLSVVVEGERLEADVTGEVFDPGKHLIYREIKAVTYHKFTIHQEGDRLRATIFLDI